VARVGKGITDSCDGNTQWLSVDLFARTWNGVVRDFRCVRGGFAWFDGIVAGIMSPIGRTAQAAAYAIQVTSRALFDLAGGDGALGHLFGVDQVKGYASGLAVVDGDVFLPLGENSVCRSAQIVVVRWKL